MFIALKNSYPVLFPWDVSKKTGMMQGFHTKAMKILHSKLNFHLLAQLSEFSKFS
jgi:hypothetical protein